MRILLCSNFLYRRGGDCTDLFNVAEILQSHGHDVLFFSMHHPENIDCKQSKYFVDHIDYAELNKNKSPAAALEVLRRSVFSTQARRNIRQLLHELRPDIVHLHNIHAHLTPSILTPIREFGCPIVWTLHDYKLLCPEDSFLAHDHVCEACKGGRFYNCLIRRCKKGSTAASGMAMVEAYTHRLLHIPRQVDAFIAPSRFLQSKFIEFGWPEEKLHFIRYALRPMPELHLEGYGYGLFIGQLRKKKGVHTLIQALHIAGDPPFHITGDGPEREALEEQASSLGLKNTQFLGWKSGDDLRRETDGADYGVVCSEWYENCPFSVFEQQARGKAVIASRIGGLAELIKDKKNGYLFDPGDVDQLADCVRKIIQNTDQRTLMGTEARRQVTMNFDPETQYEALMSLYNNLKSA